MSIFVKIKKRLAALTLDVRYEAASGTTLGILGASGSGKSMSLKCIAGIETPDEGEITLDGKTLFDSARTINLKPRQRRAGYLFQQYALFPHLSLLDNLTIALNMPRKEKNETARRWIAKMGLAGMEDRKPRALSGGQQQRAAFARMLICKPDIVLLDEPFSALDNTLREQMWLEYLTLMKEDSPDTPRNAILVSHSRDEVYRLCPYLAIIDRGRTIIQGDTRAVFENPRTLRAAEITGCKNFSRIEKRGDYEVYALDWGIKMRTARMVEDGVTYAGIRAHAIENSAGKEYNTMSITVKERVEGPFETTIVFTNAHGGDTRIWRQYPVKEETQFSTQVFFPPESILLLKNP